MKKNIFILVFTFLLLGCEDPIDIDLPDPEARLVIDAYFENRYNDDGSFLFAEGSVKLSTSAPFFDDSVPVVSNATVYITNLNNNTILNFTEEFETGIYYPENGAFFIPDLNTKYELTVIHNNETYIATTELIPSVPIDFLEQRDGVLFAGDETELFVQFKDNGSRNDFYLFDLDFDLFLTTEDTFYQGKTFNFSYFYDSSLEHQQLMEIKIMGIDESYYNYFNLIQEQTEQNGNPFQTVPALIRGNIINNTDINNYAFGYFRLSQAYAKNITIIKDDN